MRYTSFGFLPITVALALSCNTSDNPVGPPPWTTLEEIRTQGMVSCIGKEILLKTRVTWDHMVGVISREKSIPDTLRADAICINFENGDAYVRPNFRGQQRGNVFLISPQLSIVVDDSLVEQYAFRNEVLDTAGVYLMYGSFSFREWLHIDDPMNLKDSVFIRQSNDVTYWSQTFQFNLTDIMLRLDQPDPSLSGPSRGDR